MLENPKRKVMLKCLKMVFGEIFLSKFIKAFIFLNVWRQKGGGGI